MSLNGWEEQRLFRLEDRVAALEKALAELQRKVSPAVDRYGSHEPIFGPGHDGYGSKEAEETAIQRGRQLGQSLRDRLKVDNG